MAEGTRLKQIEAQLQEFREFMASTQQFMVDTKKQQDETKQSLVEVEKNADRRQEQLIELMRSLLPVDGAPRDSRQDADPIPREQGVQIQPVRGILGAGRPTERIQDPVAGNSEANSPQDLRSWNSEGRGGHNRLPKLDFPSFDGSKPRCWVRRCERYFTIFAIPEFQRVEIASMYVLGKADVWLQGFMMQQPGVSWKEFLEAICARFGEHQGSDVVEEFNKLEQTDSLEVYAERFEELKAYMLAYDSRLPESYFVSSFISGLRGEIKSLVKMGRPTTLAKAYEYARLHNETVQAIVQLSRPSVLAERPPPKPVIPDTSTLSGGVSQRANPILGNDSRDARRLAGLCYKCGERYFVGHRCRVHSVHSLLASQLEEFPQTESGLVSNGIENFGQELVEANSG